jgi:hypothetical protein
LEKVIVAVKRPEDTRPHDLELPAEIPISELSLLIVEAMHWDSSFSSNNYSLKAHPAEKILDPQQTLISALVRTGSTIEFIPTPQSSRSNSHNQSSGTKPGLKIRGPVIGMISVLDDAQTARLSESSPESPDVKPPDTSTKKGYTWKKIS